MQSTTTANPMDDNNMIEGEIDLRKYIVALARRWRLILTSTIVASLLGGLFTLIFPPPYEAAAGVAIIRTSTQVEFDPKLKTLTSDELAAQAQTTDSRRNTLVGLVANPSIAEKVIKSHSSLLEEREKNPAVLGEKVRSELVTRGDLVMIKVRDANPNKASEIANAWAEEYETFVNRLYVGAGDRYVASVRAEFERAEKEALASQKELENFIATSEADQFKRTIDEKKQILDALQLGRQNAVTLVISEQLRANSGIIAAYLDAQSQNRLIAFEKEQEGRRKLVGAILNAANETRVGSFSEQVRADISTLQQLYASRVKTRQMIIDARAMRDSIQQGGDSAAKSNNLALALLKAQAFALTSSLSNTIQINLPTTNGSDINAQSQLVDLNALVQALEGKDKSLSVEIERLTKELLSGAEFRLPSGEQLESSVVNEAISRTYPLLFDVGSIGRLSENIPVSNPLTIAAQERANELMQFRMSTISVESITGATKGDDAINVLQQEIREAQSKLERDESQMKVLEIARDLKRDTFQTLGRKLAEVNLSSAITGSEVRFAVTAVPPDRRSTSQLLIVMIAGLIGLLLGIVLSIIVDTYFANDIDNLPKTNTFFNRAKRFVLGSQ